MSGSKNKKRIALRYSEHLSKMKDKDKKYWRKKDIKRKILPQPHQIKKSISHTPSNNHFLFF